VAKVSTVPAGASPSLATAPDADTLLRTILFVVMFLAVWISFHPFQSLAEPPRTVTEGGDRVNQIAFSVLFVALAAWMYFQAAPLASGAAGDDRDGAVVCRVGRGVLGVRARRATPDLHADDHGHGGDRAAAAEEPAPLQRHDGRHGAGDPGALPSRRRARTTTRRPPGDRFPRAGTRRRVARPVQPQEHGRRDHGAVRFRRHVRRPRAVH